MNEIESLKAQQSMITEKVGAETVHQAIQDSQARPLNLSSEKLPNRDDDLPGQ